MKIQKIDNHKNYKAMVMAIVPWGAVLSYVSLYLGIIGLLIQIIGLYLLITGKEIKL